MALSKIPNYLQDLIDSDAIGAGAISSAKLPAGSVLQVVDDFFIGEATISTNTTFTISTVDITPKFASSKILVQSYFTMWQGGNSNTTVCLTRDGGNLNPDPRKSAADQLNFTGAVRTFDDPLYTNNYDTTQESLFHIDNPNTTSQITYRLFVDTADTTVYVNTGPSAVNRGFGYGSCGLVVMEIAQ